MKHMKKLTLSLALAALLPAQQTRREIVNAAPTPAEDAKPNSDKVPDVYAISGQFQRIVILRFKYDADLLAGMGKAIQQEKIRNAVILSGAGQFADTRCTRSATGPFLPRTCS